MSAKPKAIDPYADEDGPFISQALLDDLAGEDPSPAARAFMDRIAAEADADPRPRRTHAEVWAAIDALHARRIAAEGA